MMKKTWILLLSIMLLISATGVAGAQDFDWSVPNSASHYTPELDSGNISYDPYAGSTASGNSNVYSYDPGLDNSVISYDPGTGVTGSADYDFSTDPVIVGVGEEATGSTTSGTQSLDWYGVGFDLVNANKSLKVYDINTGVSWGATYINGKNHADVIPASQEDSQKLTNNNITGSYVRRPVLVTIAGTQYAGSMYAVGHGDTSYCNYFKGVMCIHFTGSQTHGSGKVDSDHQSAIGDALNYGNGG